MIKYLILFISTATSLSIQDYIAGLSIYFLGLLIYEVVVILSFIKKRKNENNSNANINS